MKVGFFLKSYQRDPALILLKCWGIKSFRDRFAFSIGESISPPHWDKKAQRAKLLKDNRQAAHLNAILDKYEDEAMNFIRQYQLKHTKPPTAEELRRQLERLKAKLNGRPLEEENGFRTWVKAEVDKIYKKNPATGRSYRSWYREFHEFCKATRRTMEWGSMNSELFTAYQSYLIDKGQLHNTVTMKWKRLKRMLNAGAEMGLYESQEHRRKSLAKSYEKADNHFLTVDKLMKIYSLELPEWSPLEKYRDTFLLDAFAAGFRFSDLSALEDGKLITLVNRAAMKIETKKTKTSVITPGSWYLDEFLKKYRGNMPKRVSNQKYNKYIKEVCKLAGLNEPVTLRKGDEEITMPEFQAVSQYTARYSFATNLYLAGVEIKQISVLLGHKRVSTTETYIKAKQLDTALAMSKNPFFTEKPAVGR
jgi:site-specific recombinase XerD